MAPCSKGGSTHHSCRRCIGCAASPSARNRCPRSPPPPCSTSLWTPHHRPGLPPSRCEWHLWLELLLGSSVLSSHRRHPGIEQQTINARHDGIRLRKGLKATAILGKAPQVFIIRQTGDQRSAGFTLQGSPEE